MSNRNESCRILSVLENMHIRINFFFELYYKWIMPIKPTYKRWRFYNWMCTYTFTLPLKRSWESGYHFHIEDGIRKIQTFSSGFQDRFRPFYGLVSWKYLKNLFVNGKIYTRYIYTVRYTHYIINIFIQVKFRNIITFLDLTFKQEKSYINFKTK